MPTAPDSERSRAVEQIKGIVAAYRAEHGSITTDRDMQAIGYRVWAAGFRLDTTDPDVLDRLHKVEGRLAAVEGWCGLSRYRP